MLYGKRVRNVRTGETGIVVARPIDDCPNLSVAPDYDARLTVCWLKSEIVPITPTQLIVAA